MLVVCLLVVAGALALPTIKSMQAGPRMTAATDLVRARLTDARTRAVEERRAYRFAVKEGTGDFRIAPDSPEFWDDGSGSGLPAGPGDSPLVVEGSLPETIAFDPTGSNSGSGGGDWTTMVTFQGDGTSGDDAQISLRPQDGAPATLRLQGGTGVITTAPAEPS
jgi:hypothetical protein